MFIALRHFHALDFLFTLLGFSYISLLIFNYFSNMEINPSHIN